MSGLTSVGRDDAYSVGPTPADGVERLHLNEYRGEHHKAVSTALFEATVDQLPEERLCNYQTGPDEELVWSLVEYVGAPNPDHVLVAAGSDEVLRAIVETAPKRGQTRVVMGVPGYTHFRHYAKLRDLEIIEYAIGLEIDAGGHEATLRYYAHEMSAGCLVYLCSPNNPTGNTWSKAQIAALAREFPSSTFLIDEAYVEFASAAAWCDTGHEVPAREILNSASAVSVALTAPNVVVTRTMSKAFGLAALRIGYAVATPTLLRGIAVAISPKTMNPIAAPVACAVLAHVDHYLASAFRTYYEAGECARALRKLGYWVSAGAGNFFLVFVSDTKAAIAHLERAGIAVRDRSDQPGLDGFVRVTAGSARDTHITIAAFTSLRQSSLRQSSPADMSPPQLSYTRKGTVAAVKTLMRAVVAVLRAAGVEYWAQSGTMLGMYRHRPDGSHRGGMIPWDDDGDLAYLRVGGVDSVAALGPAFAAVGLTLQRNRTDAYWQVGTNAAGETISPVHIDVFSYGGSPETGYTLDDPRFATEEPDSSWAHCNTRYAHDELFPLDRSWYFYDVPIPMPAAPEPVLRRSLGENFMTVAKVRLPSGGLLTFDLKDRSPA